MATKTKKTIKSLFGGVDAEYGKKLRAEDRKEGRLARKRLKEFTTITGSKKKTRWYY